MNTCKQNHNVRKYPLHGNRPLIFMVVCLVAWPVNEGEAQVDLVLIETSLLFLYINSAVLILSNRNLHKKSS